MSVCSISHLPKTRPSVNVRRERIRVEGLVVRHFRSLEWGKLAHAKVWWGNAGKSPEVTSEENGGKTMLSYVVCSAALSIIRVSRGLGSGCAEQTGSRWAAGQQAEVDKEAATEKPRSSLGDAWFVAEEPHDTHLENKLVIHPDGLAVSQRGNEEPALPLAVRERVTSPGWVRCASIRSSTQLCS